MVAPGFYFSAPKTVSQLSPFLDCKQEAGPQLGRSLGRCGDDAAERGEEDGGGWGPPGAVAVRLSRRLKCGQILCLKALILMNICGNEMQIRRGPKAPGALPTQP